MARFLLVLAQGLWGWLGSQPVSGRWLFVPQHPTQDTDVCGLKPHLPASFSSDCGEPLMTPKDTIFTQ
ncbi:MAG: hypothetical protein AAFX01_04205 [Cyanobacteria bacterium J06638_28]